MKFIPPLEISSKIMTLIEEANQELVLVSPYVNIKYWDKMKKCIQRAVKRNVKITFIARTDTNDDLSFFEGLGIKICFIENLHAKLYYNDNYGIVTSQNIIYSSDRNSIDIGYQTESSSERKELVDFVNNYIAKIELPNNNDLKVDENNDSDDLIQLTVEELEKLSHHFIRSYDEVKFVTTSTYIFSKHLFPFADVMVNSKYTIKIRKSYNDCEQIIYEISKLKFNFKNEYRIDLQTSHKSFYYFHFVPIKKINFNYLIEDYQLITDQILNNSFVIEKVKDGNNSMFANNKIR